MNNAIFVIHSIIHSIVQQNYSFEEFIHSKKIQNDSFKDFINSRKIQNYSFKKNIHSNEKCIIARDQRVPDTRPEPEIFVNTQSVPD